MTDAPSAEEIDAIVFSRGRRGATYDEVKVDDFLSDVTTRLREGRLDAQAVRDARFTAPRGLGRGGYDSVAVDDLLRRVASAAEAGAYGAQDPGRPSPSGADAQRPGILSRWFGSARR